MKIDLKILGTKGKGWAHWTTEMSAMENYDVQTAALHGLHVVPQYVSTIFLAPLLAHTLLISFTSLLHFQ